MKVEDFKLLICPNCKSVNGDLILIDEVISSDSVIAGMLKCNCGKVFPITDTVVDFISELVE
jgi:uncharacterized protein YbaR (Trm112 family)